MKASHRVGSNTALPASYTILAVLLAALGATAATGAPGASAVTAAPAVAATATNARAVKDRARAEAIEESLPTMFEANQGQADPRVRLLARGPGYTLLLARREAVLGLTPASGSGRADFVRFQFIGPSAGVHVEGRGLLRGKTSYLLGNDPAEWHRDIPNYVSAVYRGVYPGIDAVFHGTRVGKTAERLELDFELAAGADPARVALAVRGARHLRIDPGGDVLLELASGERLRLGRPDVYQDIAGTRREVTGRYVLRPGHRLAFAIGAYDPKQRLIIDPTLEYSTYVAGGRVSGIALDSAGRVYLVGTTSGGLTTFPANAYQATCSVCAYIGSAFVAKYDTTQSGPNSLIYSTYLGPVNPDPATIMPDEVGNAGGTAIAVDSNGDAYVTGYVQGFSGSSYFPMVGSSYLKTMPGQHDAFVSELNPTGTTLLASTYLGGTNDGGSSAIPEADGGTGIALDGAGYVYVTGLTNSSGLATNNAPQTKLQNGFSNGTPFVAKLDTGLSALKFFTYLGSTNNASGFSDSARAIAVDSAGDAYVVGGTYVGACSDLLIGSPCATAGTFPPTSVPGFQPAPGGKVESGYLAKISTTSASGQLLYLTFLGGATGDTVIDAITLDPAGNAYVTGTTADTTLPANGNFGSKAAVCQTNAGQTRCPGSFVAGINPSGGAPLFMAYLGGLQPATGGMTSASAIALDASSNLYVAGTTSATDLPEPGTVNSAIPGLEPSPTLPCFNALPECISPFFVELAPGATKALSWGYLAGTGGFLSEQDSVAGIALDTQGNVFLAGTEDTNDFPVTPTNAYDSTPPSFGASSSYLAEISAAQAGGSPSTATYTLDGLPPVLGGLGYIFDVSAPATTSVNVPVVLTNSGTSAFTISSISLFGTDSPPWTLTGLTCPSDPTAALPIPAATPVNLAAGQSCTIQLAFAPTIASPGQTEGLAIVDTATGTNANSPAPGSATGQNVLLGGTGTAAPPPSFASYSINGTALTQTNLLLPVTTLVADEGTAASTELVLTNTGGVPFTISGVSLSPSSSPPWTLTHVSCPSGTPSAATPVTIDPQAFCTIDVQFAPTSATSPQDGLITVLDTASGSNFLEPAANTQEFILQGTVGQPYADYSTAQVTYGNVAVGSPQSQTVTITNSGTGPLDISKATIAVSLKALNTESYWTLTQDCNGHSAATLFPVSIAPGASCEFTFQLAPTAPATSLVALVSFFDNASQSNLPDTLNGSYIQQVKLYGVGVLPLTGFASSITFTPPALVFASSPSIQTLPLTMTNTGTQPVTISSVESEGDPAAFTVQQSCVSAGAPAQPLPVTLASQASCTVNVQYASAEPGVQTSLFIYDNALFSNIGTEINLGGVFQIVPASVGALPPATCGSSAGISVSAGGLEPLANGGWSQEVTIQSTNGDLPLNTWLVIEGLNTGVNTQEGVAASGLPIIGSPDTTPTDPALNPCGDAPGSPVFLITTHGTTASGTSFGLQSVGVTLIFPAGIQPSYQSLKAVSASGAP